MLRIWITLPLYLVNLPFIDSKCVILKLDVGYLAANSEVNYKTVYGASEVNFKQLSCVLMTTTVFITMNHSTLLILS